MPLPDFPHDMQPKPTATGVRSGIPRVVEGVEQARLRLRRNATTLVGDLKDAMRGRSCTSARESVHPPGCISPQWSAN